MTYCKVDYDCMIIILRLYHYFILITLRSLSSVPYRLVLTCFFSVKSPSDASWSHGKIVAATDRHIIGYIPAIDMHFFAKIMFVAGSYEYIRTVLCFTTTGECWQSWDQTGFETWFVERFHCYWLHLNHISHADLLMISVFCLLILLSFGDIPVYIYIYIRPCVA